MTTPICIPTNFKVPETCHHEWMLFYENEFIAAIYGVPGKSEIHHIVRAPSVPHDQSRVLNQNLDWITESVEHLRAICDG